ncbi:MAG: carbon-nitrogen hydrolase family protein [Gemmatimonadetes bacterium]|jgi:5-aminopentanamidase|nr:carbon-nitrogen hydrolase family protein [Gemmatimonadota bacterium]
MRRKILASTRFQPPPPGWDLPSDLPSTSKGHPLATPERPLALQGPGVHTRNGDVIELHFTLSKSDRSSLRFGFSGGMESAVASLDFRQKKISLSTSEWTRPQPVATATFKMKKGKTHALRIEKTEGKGTLIKNADVRIFLDDELVLAADNLDILPEMGVTLNADGTRLQIDRFVHRGIPSGIPDRLHVGGWQMLNKDSIEENLASLCRGLKAAAAKGVQLLVTPETSLTGLFPTDPVTQQPRPIAAAEKKLRQFLRDLDRAPYLVVGLPVWERIPGHRRQQTRYNVSRLYDPDGEIASTHAKIHSCESEFWHGYKLQEFDIYGAPVCMHICHDGRYPELWALPVMFGARLILHPSNGGLAQGSVDAFEAGANRSTSTSHAFYLHINGGGGSYLTGPQKFNNLLAVSDECRRSASTFPMVGPPRECLFDASIPLGNAYGYWPVRSYRASETVAAAYVELYRSLGGQRI